jgi:hypothetical protein
MNVLRVVVKVSVVITYESSSVDASALLPWPLMVLELLLLLPVVVLFCCDVAAAACKSKLSVNKQPAGAAHQVTKGQTACVRDLCSSSTTSDALCQGASCRMILIILCAN